MKKRSKRYQERAKLMERGKRYNLQEAVQILKQVTGNKCDETVALDFQLGIRPEQSNEMVRGTVSLPHGSGKNVRVLCFCKGASAQEAKEAGADFVGAEELVQKVQGGWFEFDVVVAHPDMMREVSKLGRVLGPRGLMPTPKAGTVSPQVGKAIGEVKAGRIEFKNDKTGGLHAICGKLSFDEKALLENARSVVHAVRDAKPQVSKGDYFKSITITLSQGPGIRLSAGGV